MGWQCWVCRKTVTFSGADAYDGDRVHWKLPVIVRKEHNRVFVEGTVWRAWWMQWRCRCYISSAHCARVWERDNAICWTHLLNSFSETICWLHLLTSFVDFIFWIHLLTSFADFICWFHLLTSFIWSTLTPLGGRNSLSDCAEHLRVPVAVAKGAVDPHVALGLHRPLLNQMRVMSAC